MGEKDEVETGSSPPPAPPVPPVQMDRLRMESESASSDGGLENLEPLELDDIKNYYAEAK